MFGWLGQYLTKSVVTTILVAGTVFSTIWFWRHPEQLALIWTVVKRAAVWVGFVLAFPWATFFVTQWIVRKESNRAAAMMLVGYGVADLAVAMWLAGGVRGHDGLTWAVLLLGLLCAAVYNLKVCEYLATRMEEC